MAKDKKELSEAGMVYKLRHMASPGRTVKDIYASFIKESIKSSVMGSTLHYFNDGSQILEMPDGKLKIDKEHKWVQKKNG